MDHANYSSVPVLSCRNASESAIGKDESDCMIAPVEKRDVLKALMDGRQSQTGGLHWEEWPLNAKLAQSWRGLRPDLIGDFTKASLFPTTYRRETLGAKITRVEWKWDLSAARNCSLVSRHKWTCFYRAAKPEVDSRLWGCAVHYGNSVNGRAWCGW